MKPEIRAHLDLTDNRSFRFYPLARAERLEGDDGVGVLDAGNDLHLLVDEMADIRVLVDVEPYQEIVIAPPGPVRTTEASLSTAALN